MRFVRTGRRAPFVVAALAAAGFVSVAAGCGDGMVGSATGSSSSRSSDYSVAPYTGALPTTSDGSGSSSTSSTGSSSTSGGSGGAATGSTSGSTTGSSTGSSASSGPRGKAVTNPQGSPTRVYVFNAAGKTIVNASLQPTYLDSKGVLAPPAGTAGWYAEQGWALPGKTGAAILVGHVTYNNRPDTFYNLLQVKPGNKIIVAYSSGQQVEFTANASRAVSKAQVPKDGTIWAASSKTPVLRLITCDPNTPIKGGHFEGNWVVWANPA